MAKNTHTDSYLSGTGSKISIMDSFVYELSVYKVFKDRAECLGSKYYSSPKELKIKKDCKIKKYKDFSICIYIDWIGAPKQYIVDNNLELIIPKTKKKNEAKSRHIG